ncbi:MAG: sigma-70 family RNA polymerase sigma factor [Sedimentisphaerales bacterium]|jgi:RNA polymerase sigma factor (sigma-70 family)
MRDSKRLELFEKLNREHAPFINAVMWKLTADADLFAEALQYAMLGIWQNLEKLTGPKAGAYIYRIALSANSKAWRNRTGKNGQIPITKPPENDALDEETLTIVRKEIAKLPEQQSQAIVMRYIEQSDYRLIADKLDCTEDTARSHVSKALNALRNNLAGKNLQES